MIEVEVIYAMPGHQEVCRLRLPTGTTAGEALRRSGLLQMFPQLDADACALGIFGREIEADHVLDECDRVEVYRPLLADPKLARRRRAAAARRQPR